MSTRLSEYYKNEVYPALKEKFNYDNVMMIPKLKKITL
ncbi:MAG TPA: 50S ribosomal protein L5, partial [Bacillota bacterium]|nr:50S ribosomal protein L5 [Bacillota bacterium]